VKDYRKEIEARALIAIDYGMAMNAYRNISTKPEEMANGEQELFAQNILDAFDKLSPLVDNDAKVEIFKKSFDFFYHGYLMKTLSRLTSLSRCFSVLITGSGNINVDKHQKANDIARSRSNEAHSYYNDKIDKIKKDLSDKKVILSTDKDVIPKLRERVAMLERNHILQLASNKIMRGKDTIDEKLKQISKLNNADDEFMKDLRHSIDCRCPMFITKNNTKVIKDAKARLKKMEMLDRLENKEDVYDLFKVVTNYREKRYQIFLNETPSPEAQGYLKSLSFKWSQKNCAWQCHITANGRQRVIKLIQNYSEYVRISGEG